MESKRENVEANDCNISTDGQIAEETIGVIPSGNMGTICHNENYNPEKFTQVCHLLIKQDLNTDLPVFMRGSRNVISILSEISNDQRQTLKGEYKKLGRDLAKDIEESFAGYFGDLLMALLAPPGEYEANIINSALNKGDAKCLVFVFCSRMNNDTKSVTDAYKSVFDKDLEEDIRSADCLSHDFRRVLHSLVQTNRDEIDLTSEQIDQEVNALNIAGDKKFETEESELLRIIGTRTVASIKTIHEKYGTSGYKIKGIDDTNNDGGDEVKRINNANSDGEIQRINNANGDVSEQNKETDETNNDGGEIKEIDEKDDDAEVKGNEKSTIRREIEAETSGDFRDALLAIVSRCSDETRFWAEAIGGALDDSNADDVTLSRLIVLHAEKDLQKIKERYLALYGTPLYNCIDEATSGDYRKLLLKIVGK